MEDYEIKLSQPPAYAMVYCKMQEFGETYDGELALSRGTAYPDLDYPLLMEEVMPRERD